MPAWLTILTVLPFGMVSNGMLVRDDGVGGGDQKLAAIVKQFYRQHSKAKSKKQQHGELE